MNDVIDDFDMNRILPGTTCQIIEHGQRPDHTHQLPMPREFGLGNGALIQCVCRRFFRLNAGSWQEEYR